MNTQDLKTKLYELILEARESGLEPIEIGSNLLYSASSIAAACGVEQGQFAVQCDTCLSLAYGEAERFKQSGVVH